MTKASGRAIVLVKWWSAVLAGALLILAVVAVNGHPTVFTDTDDYYALGKELVTDIGLGPPPPELSDADVAQAKIDRHMGLTQMASRSAIYSVFLYVTESAGTLWLVALAQASAVSWLVLLLWRTALPAEPRWSALVAITVIAVVSPLPFFAAFAMPDIFAGVVVVAAVLILVYGDRLGRWERRAVGALLTIALAVHTSHILFMVPLLGIGGLMLIWLKAGRRAAAGRLTSVGVAIVVALAANSLYGAVVRLETGEPLRNQPFLTARLLADGPGRTYLRHACAKGNVYTLCGYKAKPLSNSEDVLWSDLPKNGVFMLADYKTRVELEEQEPRFVLGTLAYAPGAQLAASLKNWGQQLILIFVEDPIRNPHFYLTDPYWRQTNLPPVIERVADCGKNFKGCPSRLTMAQSRSWHGAWLIAAAAALALAATVIRQRMTAQPGAARGDDRRLLAVAIMFAAGVILNAAVCGILSGPFPRYQSRIVWLIPAGAVLLLTRLRRERRHGDGTATLA
ncbi:hypothetical protein KZX46_17460 [Polymorphobacter sp. PAMC 29334]|uniref:hypothetical protein n=1 Tax=Polymorphobacter sp. PAMC 29334 TaxID=2862331 RepID=UPI001C73F7CB|nr:hypothetical protein [Polymorphobacter sp. PAMC 29334]QYE34529.1 hypothetical protein KZX46_17460 [Polymorphobacter sp. PAMC 29334]